MKNKKGRLEKLQDFAGYKLRFRRKLQDFRAQKRRFFGKRYGQNRT
jgi:hypothetical protein